MANQPDVPYPIRMYTYLTKMTIDVPYHMFPTVTVLTTRASHPILLFPIVLNTSDPCLTIMSTCPIKMTIDIHVTFPCPMSNSEAHTSYCNDHKCPVLQFDVHMHH